MIVLLDIYFIIMAFKHMEETIKLRYIFRYLIINKNRVNI